MSARRALHELLVSRFPGDQLPRFVAFHFDDAQDHIPWTQSLHAQVGALIDHVVAHGREDTLWAALHEERPAFVDEITAIEAAWNARAPAATWDPIAAFPSDVRASMGGGDRAGRGPSSPVFNLPARRAQTFVGREHELAMLDELLQPGRRVGLAPAASIEGLAGIGKTELALQTAYRLARSDRFPAGIVWLDAEQPDLIPQWGGAIADALGIPAGTPQDRAAAVMRRISNVGPVLLILDNVTGWTSTSMPRPLPTGPEIALLITTRERNLAGSGFEHVTVDRLAPDPARTLLTTLARGNDPERDLSREPGLDELLTHLDGHALALELAGAYLCEVPGVTPAAYLERLHAGAPVEETVSDRTRYEHTVAEAFDATVARLDDASLAALRICGQFADAPATLALLRACGVTDDAITHLRRFHLITTSGDRWTMHRLPRAYARRGNRDRSASINRFLVGCFSRANEIDLPTGFRIYRADRAHFERAVELAQVSATVHAELNVMLNRLGTGAQSSGDFVRARGYFTEALDLTISRFGEGHALVGTLRSNLALVLRKLGELSEARELLERTVAEEMKLFGPLDRGVIISLSNLALVHSSLGDAQRALALHAEVLALRARALGEHHPSVARDKSDLAVALHDMGESTRARDLLEEAVESLRSQLGDDHPDVATARGNLGMVLMDLGDGDGARHHLEEALASDVKNRGEDDPTVALRLSNLATFEHGLGHLDEARALIERALAADLAHLGPASPEVALDRSTLACVLKDLGDVQRARDEIRRALAAIRGGRAPARIAADVERAAAAILGDSRDTPT